MHFTALFFIFADLLEHRKLAGDEDKAVQEINQRHVHEYSLGREFENPRNEQRPHAQHRGYVENDQRR